MIDRTELHAFVDGELDAETRRSVERAMTEDDQIRREVHAIQMLKETLSREALKIDCPDTWKSSVRRLDEIDKARRIESFVGRYSWALCGIVALALIGGGLLSERPGKREAGSASFAQAVAGFSAPGQSKAIPNGLQDQALQAVLNEARIAMARGPIVQEEGVFSCRHGQFARFALVDGIGSMRLAIFPRPIAFGPLEAVPARPGYATATANGVNWVVWNAHGATLLLYGSPSHDHLLDVAANYCVKPDPSPTRN